LRHGIGHEKTMFIGSDQHVGCKTDGFVSTQPKKRVPSPIFKNGTLYIVQLDVGAICTPFLVKKVDVL